MLYFLVTAMYPRMLITLDENLNALPVTVRVGQVNHILLGSGIYLSYDSHRLSTS